MYVNPFMANVPIFVPPENTRNEWNGPSLFVLGHAQLIFTCSKSIIETLEKNVKYVQS